MADLTLKQVMQRLDMRDYKTLKRWMTRAQVTPRHLLYSEEDAGRVQLLSEEEVEQVRAYRAQFSAYIQSSRAPRGSLASSSPSQQLAEALTPVPSRYHSPVTRPLASWQRASFVQSALRRVPDGHMTMSEFCRLHTIPARTARNKIDNHQLSPERGEVYKLSIAGSDTWVLTPLGQARSFQFWGNGRHIDWRNCPACPHSVPAPNIPSEAGDDVVVIRQVMPEEE